MVQKRKDWNGLISGFKASDLVFLDESGCNTDMTRRYAYSLGGSRAVDSAPLSKPKNTTILSSIQLDGTLHYTTFSGGTTVEKFKQYLKTDLLPHLNGDSVLVMDNMKSHHTKAVKNLLDRSGIRYIYLPLYSPDLNPIEKLWSKVKSFLRKFKARTLDALPMRFRMLFTLLLSLIVPAGSASVGMCFNFENCYRQIRLPRIKNYNFSFWHCFFLIDINITSQPQHPYCVTCRPPRRGVQSSERQSCEHPERMTLTAQIYTI